jgi:hypothetical protein
LGGTVSESDSDAREEKAMSFYGRLWGAVFKYYLNAIDEANADWQSAENEEARAITDGSGSRV